MGTLIFKSYLDRLTIHKYEHQKPLHKRSGGMPAGVETVAAWLTVGLSVVFASWSAMLLGKPESR
jgi:hypothetical protein